MNDAQIISRLDCYRLELEESMSSQRRRDLEATVARLEGKLSIASDSNLPPANDATFYGELSMIAAMLPHCTIGDTPDEMLAPEFHDVWRLGKMSDQERADRLIQLNVSERAAVASIVANACRRMADKLN